MNKRPENIVGKIQANHGVVNGCNEPVLYFDFDGVLHAYEVGRLDIPEDVLFAFRAIA